MKIVKISKELLTQIFEDGTTIHWKIEKGIPKNCKLTFINYDRQDGILQLGFLEVEDIENIDVEIKKIGE